MSAYPSVINKNTLKVYHFDNIKFKPTKRVLSINLNQWKEKLPKQLSELCIETIANNWEVNPLLNELPLLSDVTTLLDVLRTDLPLELTVPVIAYDTYWMRSYKARWPKTPPMGRSFSEVETLTWTRKQVFDSKCPSLEAFEIGNETDSVNNLRKTWKELYLEKHMEEYLQNLEVELYDNEKVSELSKLCKKYITSLNIRELKAPTSTNNTDHIPLNIILTQLVNLTELNICFKQKYVGEKFSWHIFNTTMIDIKNLTKGLECSQLQILRIQNSDINCTKTKMILKSLSKNETLKELEISHCKIADHGVMAISKFVKNHSNITSLNLVNNYIGFEGAKSLAYLLMENNHFKSLNLRLNIINSVGGKYLFFALAKGKNRLENLNLSGCGLNSKNLTVEEMLRSNDKLETLNLSNNRVGKEVGRSILSGLRFNETMKNFDCRRCDIPANVETRISEICEQNRYGIRKKEICWDPPENPIKDTFQMIFSEEFLNDFENILND